MAEPESQPNRSSSPSDPGASAPGSASEGASETASRDDEYLVAARKYRPARFEEVVAQEHVTDTLKNALKLDRLAHAYLFSGPRGVGKTTTARILAKAINCETPPEERDDAAEPCRTCDSCRAFEAGRSLNVFEMDAASNNKVDDIRELRETVRIPPQGSTKKVYILDEVHMLSTQAFNALLKTLEEPPPHALFIFATTEPHKVLPTILSRCQRFDFRRIPVPRIVDHLRRICDNEGIEADEESLMLLARKGDGALRDALSAFDQAISLCGTTLQYGDLTQALGVVDQDLFFRLTDHVATQDTAGVLRLVNRIVRSGYDLQEFLGGLAEHLRNLLVARSLGDDALEEVAASTRQRYAEEAQRFGEADLLRLLTLAGDAEDDVKSSSQPRLKLEMALLKMAQMRRAADLKQVLQTIDRLEQMAEQGDLPETLPASSPPDNAPRSAGTPPSDAPAEDAGGSDSGLDSEGDSEDGAGGDSGRQATSPDDGRPGSGTGSSAASSSGASGQPSPSGAASAPEEASAPEAASAPGEGRASGAAPSSEDASSTAPSSTVASSPDASASSADPSSEAATDAAGRSPESIPDEPDDPGFTPPFDEPEADDDDESTGPDNDGGGPADDEPEDPDGGVGYGDLFGTPALKESAPDGSDGPDGLDGSDADEREGTDDGAASAEAASGRSSSTTDSPDPASSGREGRPASPSSSSPMAAYGDGQAAGSATDSMVAEPDIGGAAPDPASAGDPSPPLLDAVRAEWEAFVQTVMADKISLGALLGDAEATDARGGEVVIAGPKSLHRDQFQTNQSYLLRTLREVVDAEIESLRFVIDRTEASAAAQEAEDTLDPQKKMEKLREHYPALDRLFDQFGAELVW